jgi:hypothetical protein
MKQIELTADLPLTNVLQQAQQEDILVMRQAHAVALIRGLDDEELYWYAREQSPEFLASLARAREEVNKGQTIRHEDLKRQLGDEESRT